MSDKKYNYNGKEYSYSDLQTKYGDRTDEAINKFGFKEVVSEPKYSYNGKDYSYADLKKKYGDRTDEAIEKFGFEQVGLKKKETSNSTVPQQNSESNSENISSDYGNRNDGTKKSRGYFGELKMKDGSNDFATEISIGVNIDGKEREIPTLVPTLSESEKDWLLRGNDPNDRSEIGEKIIGKAIKHARGRIASNKSPFYEGNVEGTLDWNQVKIKQNNPEITRLFDDYQSAKIVSDDKRNEIIQSVDDEINQTGLWNNIKAFGKKAFNFMVDTSLAGVPKDKRSGIREKLHLETNPLSDELKQVNEEYKQIVSQAKADNKPIPIITDEQKLERARDLKIEKQINSQSESQVRSFLKDSESKVDEFGMSDKDKLNLFQYSELASLSEKDKLNLAQQNIQRAEINNLSKELKSLAEKARKTELSEEEKNQGIASYQRYNEVVEEAKNTYEEFISNKDDIGDVKDNIDLLKRNYGWLRNFADNAGATGLDLTAGLVDAREWIANATGTNNPLLSYGIRETSKLLRETSGHTREGIAKPISVEDINTLSDFGQWFWNTAVASQVPIYAAVATGGIGLGALGVSATGTQYQEMTNDESDYNYWQKTLVPLGYGTSETLSAYVDRMVMMNAGRIMRSATEPERRVIAKGMWEKAKGASKLGLEVAKNATYEGVDEAATEIMQNLMDIYALDKEDVGVFDNVLDASAAGAVMGAAFPFLGAIAGRTMKPFSLDNRLGKINKEILSFEEALKNQDLSENERKIIENQLVKANQKNLGLILEEAKNISEFSPEQFQALKTIERTQVDLQNQAKEILASPNMEQSMKDQIVGNLKAEFEAVENNRIGIINGNANDLLGLLEQDEVIRLKEEASKELIEEKNPNGDKSVRIEDAEISQRAWENYKKENLLNETAQAENINDDGDIRSGVNPLDSIEGEQNNQTDEGGEIQSLQSSDNIQRPKRYKTINNIDPIKDSSTFDEVEKYNSDLISEVFNDIESSNMPVEDKILSNRDRMLDEGMSRDDFDFLIDTNIESDWFMQVEQELIKLIGVEQVESFINSITDKSGDYRATDMAKKIKELKTKYRNNKNIKASENGKEYTVSQSEDGKISFTDKNGKVPSERTQKRLALEYAKQVDLTEGKKADESVDARDVEGMESASEQSKFVAENSQNPVEIAESILNNEIENYRDELDYKQRVIAENIGHVSRESFIQNSDETHVKENGSIPIQYLRKNGTPLDTKAKELSEIAGIEITEQDIVDFILDNPTGAQTFLNNGFHTDISNLKARFEEVTGLPATNEILQEVIKQNNTKTERLNNSTSIDFMSEEELLYLLNQREQYEQETNDSKIDTSREGIREIENSRGNAEISGIQQNGSGKNQGVESQGIERRNSISDRGSQGELGSSNEVYSRIQEIRSRLDGRVREIEKELERPLDRYEREDLEKRVVLDYAKENNLWIDDLYSLGEYTNVGGNENTLAIDRENNIVYKSNNLFNSQNSVLNLLQAVEYHNELFPETNYEITGFTGLDNGTRRTPHIEVVLKQEYIPNADQATQKEIDSYMKSIGFKKITDSSFKNGNHVVSDLRPRNVLKDSNGTIYVIDDIVRKENPSLEKPINLSQDLKLDKFIENLDKAIDKLDQFGKENLGMNLPLVVARQALTAMKIATKTAKSVADIISAGLNAVQQTDWYKNLSQKEKTDLDSNFIDYLNKPYETNKNSRSRDKIEKDIDIKLSDGETEKAIIDSYEDRMEKMIAKDYFERKKQVDPKTAKKQVDDSFDKSDKKMDELTKPKFDINKLFRDFVTKFFDRQFLPKFILNKADGRVVRDYIVTAKGASGYAKYLYEKAYDKIYKGLSSEQIKTLDKVIQLRRFIAIDENRRTNGLPAVVHPDYINENVAKSYLESLKQELGEKSYNDLMKRTDAYFDTFRGLLNDMHESGIISKESRDRFFDTDYQPRQFLEFMQNSEAETAHLDNETTGGLGKEQIQKLEKGLDTALVSDSQYLLSRALNVRAKTIAMNNTNRRLADFMREQAEKVEILKSKANPTKKEKEIIKYFELLQKRVKDNPIIGFTESGNPKYKRTTPNGYANAYYWVNGVKHNMFMEQEFYNQYFDALKRIFANPDVKEKAAMLSGTGLVKSIATGNNPTFFITNTPRDFLFISTFSEEYGKNLLLNMAKLTKDASLGIRDIKQENDTYQNFVKYGGMTDFLMDQGKFKGTSTLNERLPKLDNKTKERWGRFFSAVTLQKMQMYSEIGFRMGVFRRSIANQLKELGFNDISEVTDKRTLNDIYTVAASSARNTMDFNQGGTLTKDLDAFIPYLNAASQGTRVMFDNFRDRPIETTLRVTQAASLVAPIPIGLSLLFLGSGNKEDDEKELSSVELYNKALKGVSKYDKSNYFIIFNGKRNPNGEFQYYRIAKSQQLTPFFTMVEATLQKAMRESVGDNESGTVIEDLNWILQNNISPVEFGITDNVARNPILKAALSMSTGYDFFREQDISPDRGKVPVAAEGFGSKSVEDFYKKIGEYSGWSPARMKAATESIITTPSTSPYVGMIYGGMDAMFSDKETKQVMDKFAKDMAKSSINRVVKETSEYNRRIGNKEKIKEAVEKIEIDRLKTKFNFNTLVLDLKEGNITRKEIDLELKDLAKDNPYEASRMAKRVNAQLQNQKTPAFVFEVKYARSAKEKAILLADKFGDALKDSSKMQDKEKKIMLQLRQNGAINAEVMFEYGKLVK